jgi:magnesium transporter
VVDLRDLVLAPDDALIGDIMVSPVVSAEAEDLRDDLQELFAKYHYRLLPVVDHRDHLLGVVRYNEVMKGVVTKVKT